MLSEWRRVAAQTHSGSRKAVVPDIPIRLASVRTTAVEKELGAAMADWLRATATSPPWDLIERALATATGEACWTGARALAAIAALQPRAWKRVLATFDAASPAAKLVVLSAGLGKARYRVLLVHAASDPSDRVRGDALARACLMADRGIFLRVHAAAKRGANSRRLKESLARYEALYREGFHGRTKGRLWEVTVVIHRGKRLASTAIEEAPRRVVEAFGLPAVAGFIRRVLESSHLEYPPNWDAFAQEAVGTASRKPRRGGGRR